MIHPSSAEDIPYNDWELDRSIGPINGDFMTIDHEGPIGAAIQKARAKGRVALLDAGCGVGIGLLGLKKQIVQRTDLDERDVEAHGVSLIDYRDRADVDDIGWRDNEKLNNGYIDFEFGNLASLPLPQNHFDVAYAYQVLLHNDIVAPIINNILPSLASDGIFYFDSLVEQREELEAFMLDLPQDQWRTESKQITRTFMHGAETRFMHTIVKKPHLED